MSKMRHYGFSKEQALDPPLNISFLLIEIVYQTIYEEEIVCLI